MKKKLLIFYITLVTIIAVVATLTALWWNKPGKSAAIDAGVGQWHIVLAKICPVTIFALFMLFNIWIQCSNKRISKQIINPWIKCRCSLYVFLFLLPLIMTSVEIASLSQYISVMDPDYINIGYYYIMGASLIPATWFQITIFKWCIFVKKYVQIRERRLRQLLFRMEQ